MVTVEIPQVLRQLTEGKNKIEAEGESLRDLIADIETRYKGLSERIINNGELNRYVIVFLDDEDIRYLVSKEVNPLDARIPEGSTIKLIPQMAGGSRIYYIY